MPRSWCSATYQVPQRRALAALAAAECGRNGGVARAVRRGNGLLALSQ